MTALAASASASGRTATRSAASSAAARVMLLGSTGKSDLRPDHERDPKRVTVYDFPYEDK